MSERLKAGTEVDPKNLANPILAFLLAYWDEKRGARPTPSRRDVDPVEMKRHLGWIVLLDAFPDLSDFRFRLLGTKVTEYFGRDSTGRTVSEAFAPYGAAAQKGSLALLRKVARDREPIRAWGEADWLGRGVLDFELLHLPLSDDGAQVDTILGAFTFDYARHRRLAVPAPAELRAR